MIDTTWSGGSVTASSGCGSNVAAVAARSLPTWASSSGTGPMVSTCVSPGHLSSRPTARSTNIGTGSMTSVVISASFTT